LTNVEICRQRNISEQTLYRWKHKYGSMELSEAKRLKGLEEENVRLKKKVADLVLEVDILKEVNPKKW
jgi:putative transposase